VRFTEQTGTSSDGCYLGGKAAGGLSCKGGRAALGAAMPRALLPTGDRRHLILRLGIDSEQRAMSTC